MRIGHLELPVTDPMASLSFYRDVLGFKLDANQADRFVWMTSGDFVLLLRSGPPRPPGVTTRHRGSCRYFQDPDGHWFQLVDPGDDHSEG